MTASVCACVLERYTVNPVLCEIKGTYLHCIGTHAVVVRGACLSCLRYAGRAVSCIAEGKGWPLVPVNARKL
eukprot:COSAG02_NODE_5052_length_4692_cov_2.956238_3_plen_72_part_00